MDLEGPLVSGRGTGDRNHRGILDGYAPDPRHIIKRKAQGLRTALPLARRESIGEGSTRAGPRPAPSRRTLKRAQNCSSSRERGLRGRPGRRGSPPVAAREDNASRTMEGRVVDRRSRALRGVMIRLSRLFQCEALVVSSGRRPALCSARLGWTVSATSAERAPENHGTARRVPAWRGHGVPGSEVVRVGRLNEEINRQERIPGT